MNIYVLFSDEKQTAICGVFGAPQPDLNVWPNQGTVDADDPRYLAYLDAGRPPSFEDEATDIARAWRDAEIVRVSWLRDRHRDEVEIGVETSITAEQYVELLAYIKALRDWPATAEFPAEDSRPEVPDWVATQTL